tara:strand:+ start:7035 stop:8141 length:1107 start_codon:yes stop_codon:yes gene_type:complete
MNDQEKKRWGKIALRAGSRVVKAISAVKDSPYKIFEEVFDGAAEFIEEYEKFEEDPFIKDGWRKARIGGAVDTVVKILEEHPSMERICSNDYMRSIAFRPEGLEGRVGFRIYTWSVEGPYLECHSDFERCFAALGRMVWENFGSSILARISAEGGLELVPDPLVECKPSRLSEEITEYVRAFRKHGYSRGILLVGEPGLGKTWAIRQATKDLGGLSLRMEVDQVASARDITDLLTLLRPTSFMIDDLDLSGAFVSLMSRWEAVRASTDTVFATANDLSKFEPAMLRAGRFDRIIHVELDPELVSKMLEDVPETFHERAKRLPPAYLSELIKSFKVEGIEKALERLESLEETKKLVSGSEEPETIPCTD